MGTTIVVGVSGGLFKFKEKKSLKNTWEARVSRIRGSWSNEGKNENLRMDEQRACKKKLVLNGKGSQSARGSNRYWEFHEKTGNPRKGGGRMDAFFGGTEGSLYRGGQEGGKA